MATSVLTQPGPEAVEQGVVHDFAAILVNPYDPDSTVDAIHQGFHMPWAERQARWDTMIKVLRRNDVTAWRRRFLENLIA